MKYIPTTKGYSLVEVLVAVSILMLSIVGPLTIAMKSMQSAQYARQQNTAFFLAQEGITAINTLRNNAQLAVHTGASNNSWQWPEDGRIYPCILPAGCGIDFRDSLLYDNVVDCSTPGACQMRFDETAERARYQYTTGLFTPYTRVIRLINVNNHEVLVESTVSWSSTLLGGDQSVTLSASLFDLYEE